MLLSSRQTDFRPRTLRQLERGFQSLRFLGISAAFVVLASVLSVATAAAFPSDPACGSSSHTDDRLWFVYAQRAGDAAWTSATKTQAKQAFAQWEDYENKAGAQRVVIQDVDDVASRPAGYKEVRLYRDPTPNGSALTSGHYQCASGVATMEVNSVWTGNNLQGVVAHETGHAMNLTHTPRYTNVSWGYNSWPTMATCPTSSSELITRYSDADAATANEWPAGDGDNNPSIIADPGFENDFVNTPPNHWDESQAGNTFTVKDVGQHPSGNQGVHHLRWDPNSDFEIIETLTRWKPTDNFPDIDFRFAFRNHFSTATTGRIYATVKVRSVSFANALCPGDQNGAASPGSWIFRTVDLWSVTDSWQWRDTANTQGLPWKVWQDVQVELNSTNKYANGNHASMRLEHARLRALGCNPC